MKQRYRGTRGVRNYARDAKELKKPVIILGAMSVVALGFAGALFALALFFTEREIVPVFAPESESVPLLSDVVFLENELPVIPINWDEGIFFDTYTNKIVFPLSAEFEVEHTYNRQRLTIDIEGVEFPRRVTHLLPRDIVPFRVIREGSTVTIFNRRGLFYERGETEDYAYIQLTDPRERYHTIVILDAGHGGHHPGAPSVHGGRHESEINLAISQMVLEIFDNDDILILPTRTDDYFVSTASRARFANSLGDYFVSIHCNADSKSRLSNGTLTLYGVAEGSEELAEIFQNALLQTLRSADRGIHFAPEFRILRESEIPVALLELLFLSNPQEATRLASTETQRQIAETIAETIAALPPAR
jgi:N-acetylmuramoyl-L-alanine amidase